MMRHRYPRRPFTPILVDNAEFDPRAAEFDDVDYRDVVAELTFRPDPDEPRRPFAEYGR